MDKLIKRFRTHTYQTQLIAFLCMMIPSILMFYAAENNASGLLWFLLGIVAVGNLLVVLVR